MIEWTKLPRGTYRHIYNGKTADVWRIGKTDNDMCARWTVFDEFDHIYLGGGDAKTIDDACEIALKILDV